MEKIGIISPHCDDETLGCGGTILRHIKKGDEVSWIIVTKPHKGIGFNKDKLKICYMGRNKYTKVQLKPSEMMGSIIERCFMMLNCCSRSVDKGSAWDFN